MGITLSPSAGDRGTISWSSWGTQAQVELPEVQLESQKMLSVWGWTGKPGSGNVQQLFYGRWGVQQRGEVDGAGCHLGG